MRFSRALATVPVIALTIGAWIALAPPAAAATAPMLSVGPDMVVGEADGTISVPVYLSAPSTQDVTVAYQTADVSAASFTNADYTAQSGTLDFAPGVTERSVSIPITDDTAVQLMDSFVLKLTGSPTNASIARAWTRISIVDNDTVVTTPDIYASDLTVDETAGTVSLPVTLGKTHGQRSNSPVTVDYAVTSLTGDTATAGSDYTAATGTLTFAPGQSVKNIPVAITNDTTTEGAEHFHVVLSNPTGGELADPTGLITIGANDQTTVPAPAISVGPDQLVGEGDGYVDLPVTLSAPSTNTVTADYTTADVSAAAFTNADYTGVTGTLVFAPGQTLKTVRIELTDDTAVQLMDSFVLKLTGSPTNASIARAWTRISIVDNDTVVTTPDIYASDLTVDETAGTVSLPVTLGKTHGQRSNSPVTVDYAVTSLTGDTATAGSDYTAATGTLTFAPGQSVKNIPVAITNDTTTEGAEHFHVVLSNPTGGELADPTGLITIGANDQTTVPAPAISVGPDQLVGEGDGYVDLPVTLSAPSTNTVTADYTTADVSAAAFTNADYTGVTGTLVFAPGQTLKTVRIELTDDTAVQLMDSFVLKLTGSPTNASIARAWTRISIVDNDTVVTTPDIYASDLTVDETAGTVSLPVTLGKTHGQRSNSPVTVDYAVTSLTGDTATAGSDYTAATGTLTFAPGQSVKNIPVAITNDTTTEGAEHFHVVLSNPTGGELADPTGLITIGANDQTTVPAPAISVGPDQLVGEGDGYVDLPVTLSAPSTNTVTADYTTADVSAAAFTNADYTGVTGTLVFAPGQTLKTVRIELTDDTVVENPESFKLTVSNPTQATVTTSTATVTIADNDSPASAAGSSVSVSPSSLPIGGTTGATVTVRLLDANSHPAANKHVALFPTGSASVALWSGASDGNGVVTLQLVDAVKQAVTITAYDQTDSVTLTQTPTVTFTGPVPGKPAAPTASLTAAQQITVSWVAPTAPGDDPITGYIVTPYVAGIAGTARTVGAVTSTVYTGLSKGTAYSFTVAAKNTTGTGPASSASTSLTVPATVPDAPTAVTGTAGNAKVVLAWKAPASTGGSPITGYVITVYAGTTAAKTLTIGNALTATVTGLSNGIPYTFRVHALNKAGAGPNSTPSAAITPATVPVAPTTVTGTAGNAKVILKWKAPASTGGSPITGYVITVYAGTTAAKTLTIGNALTATVTGLSNGIPYTFRVHALNKAGAGPNSTPSAAITPATVPVAPTTVTGTAGNAKVPPEMEGPRPAPAASR